MKSLDQLPGSSLHDEFPVVDDEQLIGGQDNVVHLIAGHQDRPALIGQ